MRVPEFLAEQHIAFEAIVHPPAFTAQKRARFLHVPGDQVAKSVLLAGPAGYVLAILPATHHIDTGALERALGGPVCLAGAQEVAQVFYDCEWGVVSPFGTLYHLPTILEEAIDPDALIIFEANTHAEAIRMRCRDYEHLERPRRLHFARREEAS